MFAVFRVIRKPFIRLSVLFSFLWLAACDDVTMSLPSTGDGLEPGAPIAVALLVPRDSATSGDDAIAASLENAARLAVRDLEGVDVDLRVYSTAGDVGEAAVAAKQAVADGARIILGPLRSESANAAAVAVADNDVNVLSFSNNTTIAGGNLFVLGSTFQNTADRLMGYAVRQGKDRVVVVHDTKIGGELGRTAISDALSRNGGTLVESVGYERSQEGVRAAVPKVEAAVDSGDANAVFLTSTSNAALPFYAQFLPEAGVTNEKAQFIGLSRWDIPAQTLSLPGLQGGWFALPSPDTSEQFSSRYSSAYDSAPHPLASLAYDGVAAVGALAKRGNRDALSADSLTQGAGFQGATGIFRLRPDGTNERGLAVARIENNQVSIIDPAPSSFAGAGF